MSDDLMDHWICFECLHRCHEHGLTDERLQIRLHIPKPNRWFYCGFCGFWAAKHTTPYSPSEVKEMAGQMVKCWVDGPPRSVRLKRALTALPLMLFALISFLFTRHR